MKKLKITGTQKNMLESKAKAKLVKEMDIPKSQSPSYKVTKEFKKQAGNIEGVKVESMVNSRISWIKLLPHVKELLLQLYTDPNKNNMSPFWKSIDVDWDDMIQMLSSVGLLKSVDGGYRLAKVVEEPDKALKIVARLIEKMINDKDNAPLGEDMDLSKPMTSDDLFKGKVGEWLKKYSNNRVELLYNRGEYKNAWLTLRRIQEPTKKPQLEASNYPAGAEHDPNAPWNQVDPPEGKRPESYPMELVWFDKELAFFKKDGKLFLYNIESADNDEYSEYADRDETFLGRDEDGIPDIEYGEWEMEDYIVDAYVNDNLEHLSVGFGIEGYEDGDDLVEVDQELAKDLMGLLKYYRDPNVAKSFEELLNSVITTEATTAGSSGSFVGNLSTKGGPISNSNVGAEMTQIINDNEGSNSIKGEIISYLGYILKHDFSISEWLAIGKDKLKTIVDKIKSLGDAEWDIMIGLIINSLQSGENYMLHNKEKDLSKFRNNIDSLKDFVNHFSTHIGEATTTTSAGGDSGTFAYDMPAGDGSSFWTAGNSENKKVNEVKSRKNKDAKTDTQWPDGKFVEFDDCVRPGNNHVNINGGCSVGAVDNVVKTKGSKHSVISDSSIYEGYISEALKLLHDKKEGKLIVVSDLEGRAASKETFTNKKVLKSSGFNWNGRNWAIDADKLDVAKKTLSAVNKAEYIIDKLEDIEEAVEGSSADNKDLLKAKLDQYIIDLSNATDEAALSAEIRRYLTFFSKFHNYSFHNRILIYIQKPDATRVASYKKWREKHRQVRKGAKAITVLAPIIDKSREAAEPVDDGGISDMLGIKPRSSNVVGYRGVKVFDISDTDAINEKGEIPDEPQWHGDNTPSETADTLFKAVSNLAQDMGIRVTSDASKGGEKGYSAGDHINISSDVKGVGRISTMIHEMAHELMHRKELSIYYIDNGPDFKIARQLKELQAESVSYVVLKHYGIPVTHHTTYLALWKANKEKIQKNLEIISKVSQFIITKIDEEVGSGVE